MEVPKSLMRTKSKEVEQTLAELNLAHRCLQVIFRGGGEHSATPGTFFVFGSSNKK